MIPTEKGICDQKDRFGFAEVIASGHQPNGSKQDHKMHHSATAAIDDDGLSPKSLKHGGSSDKVFLA